VLEAMRRGIPVVTTPQVGAAEIVCKARGGFVVKGDAASLGEAINSLINDSTLSHSMGKLGQRYVLERHTWHHAASQIEALYEGLV
jgi:glycosyltransferase involved in cell wall biosynthesis